VTKMKATVIHPSFANFGGAELYAINVVKVLVEMGFSVKVYTLEEGDLLRYIGKLARSVKCIAVRPLLKTSSFYDILLNAYSFLKVKRFVDFNSNIVINTKANEVPVEADVCVVHYPLGYALYHWDRVPLGAGVDPKYVSGLFWRLYIQPFRVLFYRISRRLKSCKAIVTNSRWTAQLLKELGGMDSTVVYPPVDIDNPDLRTEEKGRESLVVTVSRFDPSKTLEAVLYVAKHVPEAKFVLMGRVSDEASYRYYHRMKSLRDGFSLRNVYLLPNLGDDAKKRILSKAKVYFHPTIGEHLGVAVLEGLAHGAIPVVHSFSGACIDIVRDSRYGYCYSTYKEAASIIENIIRYDMQPPSRNSLKSLLSEFSYETLRTRFSSLIKDVLGSRHV